MDFLNQKHKYIIIATILLSILLFAGLLVSYLLYHSQQALAQATDSFLDTLSASVLLWTMIVAAQPSDKNHHFGHSRAEPLGALIVAIISGGLAYEVARNAVVALLSGARPDLEWPLAVAFAVKTLVKSLILLTIYLDRGSRKSPALEALAIDARNDVLLSLLGLFSYFGAKQGFEQLDAWLALPVALWIAFAGWELANKNIRMLMGEAPPASRQKQMIRLVNTLPEVRRVSELRAQYLGTRLGLHVHVVVDPEITVQKAQEIGEAVRAKLEKEKDVEHAAVHINVA